MQRAEGKKQLLDHFEKTRSEVAVDLALLIEKGQKDWAYKQVLLKGRFVNDRHFLLDNQIFQGRFGYEIITPFHLSESNKWVLLSRGWVPGDLDRGNLPVIKPLTGELELLGEIYMPAGKAFTLADMTLEDQWPQVIQTIDVPAMAKLLDADLFPYQIRLKPKSAGAFQANWMVVNILPEKHTAYAVQWFSMAAALCIAYLLASSNLLIMLKNRGSATDLGL